jgi:hypothetical protein
LDRNSKIPFSKWGFVKNPPKDDLKVLMENLLKERPKYVPKTFITPKEQQRYIKNFSSKSEKEA